MSRGTMGLMKGIAVGVAAGVAVGAIGKTVFANNKRFRRQAGKTVRAIGDIVDNVQYMFR